MAELSETSNERRHRLLHQAKPLIITGAVVLVVVAATVAVRSGTDSAHDSAPGAWPGGANLSFDSRGVQTVELDGVNGKLTIGVGGSSQVTVASDGGPHAAAGPYFRLDAATGTLYLACTDWHSTAATTPTPVACPAADYNVSVPAGTGVRLKELSGQASLVGLSGPVSISATSADTSARDLRTNEFTAAVTSGTLDASFASAPSHLTVSVTSAHATLRLPHTAAGYAVSQQTVSADIEVGVPQSSASPYDVQAVATSGEISLLSA